MSTWIFINFKRKEEGEHILTRYAPHGSGQRIPNIDSNWNISQNEEKKHNI